MQTLYDPEMRRVVSLALSFVFAFAGVAFAPPAFAGTFFTQLRVEGGQTTVEDEIPRTCSVLSVGAAAMTARSRDVQLVTALAYRRIDIEPLGKKLKTLEYGDLAVGARYFPRKPTLWIGDAMVLRATVSADVLLGYGTASNFDFGFVASAGLGISGVRPRGLLVEVVSRLSPSIAYFRESGVERSMRISPWVGARVGIFY